MAMLLLQNLKSKKIVVTGPQRSGTTIASRIIADTMQIECIDELDYKIDYDNLKKILTKKDSFVVQAPAFFHRIMDIQEACSGVCFVIIKRNIEDIIKSEKRIDWDAASQIMEREANCATDYPGPISKYKYEKWEEIKNNLNEYLEINYEDLSFHRFWLEDNIRKNFKDKQWKL